VRFHVIYKKGKVQTYKSNVTPWPKNFLDPEALLAEPESTIITWQLNDLPLTKKFIDNFIKSIHHVDLTGNTIKTNLQKCFITDIYASPTEKEILDSRKLMNSKIDYFNSFTDLYFTIPENLKLNEQDINDVRVQNLNRLHEIFEDACNVVYNEDVFIPDGLNRDSLLDDLEELNILVHYNEQVFAYTGKDREECLELLSLQDTQFHTSLKTICQVHEDDEGKVYALAMEDQDYEHFTINKPKGWLELDFGTIGKDLLTCMWTNDVDLIKSGKLSQQTIHHPWVSYGWLYPNKFHIEITNNRFKDWVEKNNLRDYIDIDEPMYKLGRHILGVCISHDIDNAEDFYEQIFSKTPQIYGVCITDDNNKNIYDKAGID